MCLSWIKIRILIVFHILLVIPSLFVACTLNSQQTITQQNSRTTNTNKSIIQNETELEHNERIWQQSKITNYKITVESAIADALYTTLSPVEIEVREGKAVSIRHLAKDGKFIPMEEVKNTYGLMLYERREVDTIEGMFNLVKQAEEGKTGKAPHTSLLEVEYDTKFGYPASIKFNRASTDSSIFLRIRKLEIIE
jgi:uncharacterized NAD(P)/FAD-binding protein YdhS